MSCGYPRKKACPERIRSDFYRIWWSQAGSNRRPQHCQCCALPAELWPRKAANSRGLSPFCPLLFSRSRHRRAATERIGLARNCADPRKDTLVSFVITVTSSFIPANVGIQGWYICYRFRIPAFARMTVKHQI